MSQPVRILVAKVGLDGHDRERQSSRGVLRDAGHEVIYTGLPQSAENVVETAIHGDVGAIGISVLSGAHMTY